MTCRAETRDPEVDPPIPRSVDRASSSRDFRAHVAPTEPSGRHWTPCVLTLRREVKLTAGMIAGLQWLLRSAKSASLGRWTKSAARAIEESLLSHRSLVICGCIKAGVQRPMFLISVAVAEHHSHHVGAESLPLLVSNKRKIGYL